MHLNVHTVIVIRLYLCVVVVVVNCMLMFASILCAIAMLVVFRFYCASVISSFALEMMCHIVLCVLFHFDWIWIWLFL